MTVKNGLLEAHNAKLLGSGNKVVVLAHGFGTDKSVWQYVVPYFVRKYRVLVFDLRCAGSTNPGNFDFSRYTNLFAYVEDLLGILDALQIASCVYVGHSVSGMIGCIASTYRPHQFEKLILLSVSPRYLNDVDYYGGFEQEDLEELLGAMSSNYRAWATGYAPLFVGSDMVGAIQEFSRTLFNMRPDIALVVAKTIFQSDLRSFLPKVRTPCHIMQSAKDLAVPTIVADYLKRTLGGQSVVEILDTEGHLPHLSNPEIVVPALQAALRG